MGYQNLLIKIISSNLIIFFTDNTNIEVKIKDNQIKDMQNQIGMIEGGKL